MKVLALTTLPTSGAGNRLRIEQYAPFLSTRGIDLTISPFFDPATYGVLYQRGHTARKAWGVALGLLRRVRDLRRVADVDLVIVYRESAPLGPPFFERYLNRSGVPYVFDFDDALFLAPIHPVNRQWAWLRDPGRVVETARGAQAVTTDNEYLATWARQHNPNVTTIPTPVDTERHQPRRTPRNRVPIIGWIGSSTTAPYLSILDEPLRQLSQRRVFELRVIGGEYRHTNVRVDVRRWRLENEASEVAEFDIGVQPEPDDPWVRGKGSYKAKVCMAAAVPVVASRVGAAPQVVPHGRVGFCVSTHEEWVDALDRLVTDEDLRSRLGQAGRAWVEERYSLRVQAPRLAEVLEAAVGHSRA